MNQDFNYEMRLAGDLLCNPKRIIDLDINLSWFKMESIKEIIRAIKETNGSEKTVEDIMRRIKANNPLSTMNVDQLLILKDPAENLREDLSQFFADQIHKQYVQQKLIETAERYAKEPKQSLLDYIAELKEEQEELLSEQDDGDILKGLGEFISRMEESTSPFVETFGGDLDKYLGGGLIGGSLYVIGARPAVGKTAMALNLADNIVSKNEGVTVGYFSLEMPLDQMMNRYVAKRSRINSYHLRNPMRFREAFPKEDREKAIETYKRIAQLPVKIYTAQSYRNLNKIIRTIKRNALSGGYVPIIDHALLIDAGLAKKDRRLNMIEITKRLKGLSNELNIPIVLLTQLNREVDKVTKKPVLADLQESASFEQDANVVMLLYLEDLEDRSKLWVNIAKNRDGNVGELPFKLIGRYADFSFDYDRYRSMGGAKR